MNSKSCFIVGEYSVDPSLRTITFEKTTTQLQPKVMLTLCYLAANHNQVISRDMLFDHVWDGAYVTEDAINRAISQLRSALGDSTKNPRYIETVPKEGYRLIAELKESPKSSESSQQVKSKGGVIYTTIVIIILGLIYWVNQPSVEIMPKINGLTWHDGLENKPRFSFDNKTIIYTQRGVIGKDDAIILDLENLNRPISKIEHLHSNNYIWSSDSESIFSVNRENEKCNIIKHNTIENTIHNITTCNTVENYPFDMDASPDGKLLVISDLDETTSDDVINRKKLFLIDVISGGKKLISNLPNGQGPDYLPRFSPDSKNIVFARSIKPGSQELMIYNIASHETNQITNENATITGVDWVDINNLAYVTSKMGKTSLWLIDQTGINNRWANIMIDYMGSIDVSPNGKQLVYQTLYRPLNVVIGDLDKKEKLEPKYLTQIQDNITLPAWSYDKKYIAYATNQTGSYGIWVADENMKGAKELSNDAYMYSAPEWSPNSYQLVYTAEINGNKDLCIVDIDQKKSCVTKGLSAGFPTWGLDGKSIYFTLRNTETDSTQTHRINKINLENNQVSELPQIKGVVFKESINETGIGYYVDIKNNHINKVDMLSWQIETLIDDLRSGGYYKSWDVVKTGIYYINKN
ncbi:MAG: winged helix-turn-helix domain-containing protein, partial [Marinicella sp.]